MTQEEMKRELNERLEASQQRMAMIQKCRKEIARGNWVPYRVMRLEQYANLLDAGFPELAFAFFVEAVFIAACIEAVNNYLAARRADADNAGTYADAVAAVMDPEEIGRGFAGLMDALELDDVMLCQRVKKEVRKYKKPLCAMDSESFANWIFHLVRGETDAAEWELACAEKQLNGINAEVTFTDPDVAGALSRWRAKNQKRQK